MAKKGNLTLSNVKKVSKQLDKMEKFEIEEGQYAGETVSFYPIFTEDRIQELLAEMQALQKEAMTKKIELSEEMQIHLINLLAIKHFSHFKSSLPSVLVDQGKEPDLMECLSIFRKTGLYSLFIKDIFLPAEMNKIHDAITDFVSASLVTLDLEDKINRKVEKLKMQNKDTYDKLENEPLQQ